MPHASTCRGMPRLRQNSKQSERRNTRRSLFSYLRGGGGVSGTESFYHRKRHRVWREKVLKRAGFLCEECKRYGRRDKDGLPIAAEVAHHVKHADTHPELRYVVGNGKALCKDCHNREHPEKGAWKR
jgi:5-methylcytosine-specific restriction endonuclease McrA